MTGSRVVTAPSHCMVKIKKDPIVAHCFPLHGQIWKIVLLLWFKEGFGFCEKTSGTQYH